jgi:Fuc2NAc and GlcNAc transferase
MTFENASVVQLIIVVIAAAAIAWAGTGLVRRYAIRRSLLDVPNHRSSHTAPTPRGGGLAIVVTVLMVNAVAYIMDAIEWRLALGIFAGGGLVALVGWLDDYRGLSARVRAAAHFAAAIAAVILVGGPLLDTVSGASDSLGLLYPVLAVLSLVWLTNLFNFMDGIDGIAGGEAVAVSMAGAGFLLTRGNVGLGILVAALGAACLGFLIWNWPPARIFMGDVGSGFVGFTLGTLALASIASNHVRLEVWLILLGVFVFDATVTLLRRLGREPFYEAHRRHAYQRAVQSGLSHRQVTIGVLIINAVLTACAFFAWAFPPRAALFLLLALAFLAVVYLAVERRRPMWHTTPGRPGLNPEKP